MNNNDTIVALATPAYKSAIHIIRLSGNDAFKIINAITDRKIARVGNQITYGWIIDPHTKKKIDQVLFMKFTSDHSYTGEDIIEINCHGGLYIVEKIIGFLIENGARMAERGEFTKRAFINNKINFSQAESINDLINSDNLISHQIAINNLEGYSNKLFKKWIQQVYEIMANFELAIDYPEYEEGQLKIDQILADLLELKSEITTEIANAEQTQKIAKGIRVCLVGKTNVGKSSIFNLLVKEARSIVTDIPGTTRDLVSEKINFNGYPVTFYDTAGIRDSSDKIELIGISKTKELITNADLILVIINASSFDNEDKKIINIVKKSKIPYTLVINKIDLNKEFDLLKSDIKTNAIKNNINKLIDFLNKQITQFIANSSSKVIGDFMSAHLKKILSLLNKLITDIKKKKYIDLLAIQIRQIHSMLLELTGESKDFDLVNQLFSDFCVGK